MKYVYLLQGISSPRERYIGITDNLKRRLREHSAGESPHTNKFRPWKIVVAIKFENDPKACAFERYLKSGSGRAFAERHLW
ncbi:hypothetical protein ES703_40689 [subsurface metagenome]